jgi:hypothetical protein
VGDFSQRPAKLASAPVQAGRWRGIDATIIKRMTSSELNNDAP